MEDTEMTDPIFFDKPMLFFALLLLLVAIFLGGCVWRMSRRP
jgi:hypothetical protein